MSQTHASMCTDTGTETLIKHTRILKYKPKQSHMKWTQTIIKQTLILK